MLCGLDGAWVWMVDKYLENVPTGSPFQRYFIRVSGDYKVGQIEANINVLKAESTSIDTKLRGLGEERNNMLLAEKAVWNKLDAADRKLRARSPDFDSVFLAGLMAKKNEMGLYVSRQKTLRIRIREEEEIRSDILVARNTTSTSLSSVNVEGFFKAVNRTDEASEPLIGPTRVGDNQLDFKMRMAAPSGYMDEGAPETDAAFKTEIIKMLTGDKPIETASQHSSFSMGGIDETFTSSVRQSEQKHSSSAGVSAGANPLTMY